MSSCANSPERCRSESGQVFGIPARLYVWNFVMTQLVLMTFWVVGYVLIYGVCTSHASHIYVSHEDCISIVTCLYLDPVRHCPAHFGVCFLGHNSWVDYIRQGSTPAFVYMSSNVYMRWII